MTVRDATVHDVAELAALAASAYRETYRTMVDAGVVEAVIAQSCTAPSFTRLLEDARSGAASCWSQPSAPASWPSSTSASRLTMPSFAASTARRGRPAVALGRRLSKRSERRLDSTDEYEVTVVAANVRALSFWRRHGCQPVGRVSVVEHFGATRGVRFDSAADGGDLIKMRRQLSSKPNQAAYGDWRLPSYRQKPHPRNRDSLALAGAGFVDASATCSTANHWAGRSLAFKARTPTS